MIILPANPAHHHNSAEFSHRDSHHAPAAPSGHQNKLANAKDPAAIADQSFAVHHHIFSKNSQVFDTQLLIFDRNDMVYELLWINCFTRLPILGLVFC